VSGRNSISIHQFHSGSAVADAITNSMFFVQSMLRGLGFQSEIFVEHRAPELEEQLRRLEDLRPTERDILLIHHSMGHDALAQLAALRCRKFLIYHNITPPEYLEGAAQDYAIKGYAQISELRDIVERAIADSPFNARQLEKRGFADVAVIPLLKDFPEIRNSGHAKWPYYDDAATFRVLFVGRIVAHKCQHELIEFVDRVRMIGGVRLGLVLAGHWDHGAAYKSRLDAMIRHAGLEATVTIAGRVPDEQLFGLYRAADAYVSLSEHEGFGVPLIEAMAFDLPVVAYASSAVAETLGGAGIALSDKAPTTIRDALTRLHADRRYRADLIRAQRARLLRFSRRRIAAELCQWLIEIGALDGAPLAAPDEETPAARTHYVIEGPYETSYSLGIVNRNLALALAARDGTTASIEPADGTEDYAVDVAAAARLPAAIRELVRPAPLGAERLVTIRNTWPCRPNGMLGDLRLVHLAWEESALPEPVAALINLHLDGVLAPSEYTRRAIRNSGVRVPIAVVGHGVDHSGVLPRAGDDRTRRGPPTQSQPFIFLHVSSGLPRKGIEELIAAYCLAFSSEDPVVLVVKTFANPDNTFDRWIARLAGDARYSPTIQVIGDELDQREIDFLYDAADAIVLPSRGEGFNLPAAEALARGLPVIATRHSGHRDFCNDANSWLVDCAYELSDSHLKIDNSYWARPSIDDLVAAMKTVYRSARETGSAAAARARQGQREAERLRWRDVAERVDRFVEHLVQRPTMTRRLKLGWISTYNARCGIATHSAHLREFFDANAFDITIIADDQERVGPDPDNLLRLWKKNRGGLDRVRDHLVANRFDAALFQYNFEFYDSASFAETILALAAAGIEIYVIFHRTRDFEPQDPKLAPQRMAEALRACTRLFVHSLDDVNRLHEWGLADNIVLLAHGVIDRPPLNPDGVRGLLGLSGCRPVIGSFGFIVPGKGLTELIHAFALILNTYPNAYLLLVNADYPVPDSQQERERCLALMRLLEIEDRVRLVGEFLETEEALFLLSACDTIVYPYQHSQESASGAVRLGLAAGRPVLTTPLPVFGDLGDIVGQLGGTAAVDIADGILALLKDDDRRAAIVERQRRWVRANSWAAQAERIANIILGSFEERHGVELRAPAAAAVEPPQPTLGSAAFAVGPAVAAAPDAAALLDGSVPPPAAAVRRSPFLKRGLKMLRGFAGPSPLPDDRHAEQKAVARADRARDRREWATAARHYREALDLKPENPGIWVQYGHALKESGDVAAAESAYRRSLALAGDVGDTHLQLGHALKIQGRRSEAGLAYLHALATDPALDEASTELQALGWTRGQIALRLRRERSVSG
jgi:glycosyltransferase involved in cell wall biosynthesis